MHKRKTFRGKYRIAFLLFIMLLPTVILGTNTPVPGQIIIGLNEGESPDGIAQRIDGEVIGSISDIDTHLLSFSKSRSLNDIIEDISSQPGVKFVQPDYMMFLPEVEQISQEFPDGNRPVYVRGISPETYYKQPGAYNIGVDSANLISTGENTLIAVIDNGVDFNHPLFKNAFVSSGYDYIDSDDDASTEPGSLQSHGTFVSSVILRVAPDCQILPLRTFNAEGIGNCFAIASAINRAIEDGADVINMSFSMYRPSPLIEHLVNEAVQAGVALVAAAGNDSCDITSYPGAYNYVLAVSAIDQTDYLATFSNYGDYIDVCAPGVDIYGALSGEFEWGTWSGTSFAAPFVSATCALVTDLKPGWKTRRIWNHIKATANSNLQWGAVPLDDSQYGDGCIDVYEAVLSIIKGDVNGDGEVNFLDIDYLNRHVNMSGPEPIPLHSVGDMDRSGIIDSEDISLLINKVYKKK